VRRRRRRRMLHKVDGPQPGVVIQEAIRMPGVPAQIP
jgi:hypothetical protein